VVKKGDPSSKITRAKRATDAGNPEFKWHYCQIIIIIRQLV
jgi:hypothetical protein